jgi:uncharacterized membrane protein
MVPHIAEFIVGPRFPRPRWLRRATNDPGVAMIFSNWIETVGSALDLVGVALIAIGLVIAFARYAGVAFAPPEGIDPYRLLRHDIGRAILLGLEVLVAADIIRTVAVTPTLTSVAVLGAIVAIRTFLSISLQMEVDGRFPWQQRRDQQAG